jgi:protein-disulfide isomerase
MDRRLFVSAALGCAGALSAGLALTTPAKAAPLLMFALDDMTMGNPHAPVTVIEYASASCPHCARFNNEIFPAFKSTYIDTGRVFYIFREFLTQPVSLAGAAFLVARRAGRANYFKVLDEVFHDQAHIYESHDILAGLNKAGAAGGLDEKAVKAALEDDKATKALNDRMDLYMSRDQITGTPTFFVGGARFDGEQTLAQLDTAITAAEAKAGKPWRGAKRLKREHT